MFRLKFILPFFCLSVVSAATNDEIVQKNINNILQKEQQRVSQENINISNVQNIFVNPKKLLIEQNSEENSKNCININYIEVSQQTVLIEKVKKYIDENVKDKCLTGGNISNVLNFISNIYIENGYITSRAFVKPQNLNSGKLKITIIEGKLDSISLPDAKLAIKSINSAFPRKNNKLLNLRDLEQGLEQMNRLPSNQVKMSVKPSNQVGGSNVVLNNTREKRWRVGLSSDNFGSESMGKIQSSLSLGLDNILGINDQLNFSINQNNKLSSTKGGRGNSMSLSFPKGYWLFGVGFNSHKHSQIITTPLSQFLTTGESKTSYLEAKKTFGRHKLGKSEINFKLSKKIVNNFLEDTKINVSSYDLTTFVVGLKNTRFFADSSLVSEVRLHKGLGIFGADSDRERIYPDDPEAQFVKATLDLDYSKKFNFKNTPMNYRGQLSAQFADDYLYSTEQFSAGGLYTVRGYESYSDSSSKGVLLRNEVDFNKNVANSSLRINPYLALDFGHVDKRHAGSTTLVGSAVGIRGFYKKMNFDLSYNQALKNIDGNNFTSDPFVLGKLNINF